MSLTRTVRQWFKISLNDLKTARALEAMRKEYQAGATFFSQQSVEKVSVALKVCSEFSIVKTAVKIATEVYDAVTDALQEKR